MNSFWQRSFLLCSTFTKFVYNYLEVSFILGEVLTHTQQTIPFFLQASTPILNVWIFFNCYLYSRSQVNRSLLIVFIDWRKHCLHDLIMTEWKILLCLYVSSKRKHGKKNIVFLVDDNPVINLTELRRKTTITIGNKFEEIGWINFLTFWFLFFFNFIFLFTLNYFPNHILTDWKLELSFYYRALYFFNQSCFSNSIRNWSVSFRSMILDTFKEIP